MITIETILDATLQQLKSADRLIEYYVKNNDNKYILEAGKKINIAKYDFRLLLKYDLNENQIKVKKVLETEYNNLIDKYFRSIK